MLRFKKFMDEETQLVESHFKVGDKVKCVHSGKEGVVTKVDPSEKGKYYTVKRDDGEVMQYAPDDLEALKEEVEIDEQFGVENPYRKYKNDPEKLRRLLKNHQDAAGKMRNRISGFSGSAPSGLKDELKDIEKRIAQIKDAMKMKNEEVELDEADTYAIYKKGKVFDTFRSKEDAHDSLDSMGLSPMSKKDYRVRKLPASHSNSWSMKEEVELDEGRNETLKALEGLAKRGGYDKKDFQKAHDLYKAGKLNDLRKHIYRLDTDPSEAIADVISRHDSKAFNSMYPRAKSGDYLRKIVIDHGGK